MALANAHRLITESGWRSASLSEILNPLLAPFLDRVSLSGPDVFLEPDPTFGLSAAVHELATNASKYGSLSERAGRIEVSWSVQRTEQGLTLLFDWKERNGPPCKRVRRPGFGSKLIRTVIERQLNGKVQQTFGPQGMEVKLTIPLTHERWPGGAAPAADAPHPQIDPCPLTGSVCGRRAVGRLAGDPQCDILAASICRWARLSCRIDLAAAKTMHGGTMDESLHPYAGSRRNRHPGGIHGCVRLPAPADPSALRPVVRDQMAVSAGSMGSASFVCAPATAAPRSNHVRPKIGFCNCSTGVADDAELERVADTELLSPQVLPLGPGRPVKVGWMQGLSRAYRISGEKADERLLSVAFNDECDVVVAVARLGNRDAILAAPAVMAFLDSRPMVLWAKKELGLEFVRRDW